MKPHSVKIFVKESNINFHNWYTTAECFSHPEFKRITGAVIPNWIIRIENDRGQWGTIDSEWQKAGQMFANRMQKGNIDINEVAKIHYVTAKKIWGITNFVYEGKANNFSTKKLLSTLKKMWANYYLLNGIGYIAVISDLGHGYLMGQLSKILLQKKIVIEKIQGYQSLLSSPNKKSLFWQEQLELMKLCFDVKNFKALSKSEKLDKHAKKWFWLNYGYQGPIWKKQDFLRRAKETYKSKNLKKDLENHRQHFKRLAADQKKLTKKLRITPAENYYFETARLFTFLKGYRIEIRHRYSYALDQIFIELGKRFHMPLNFFRYATKEEIADLVNGKKTKNEEILKRKQKMLYITENNRPRFVEFSRVDKIFTRLLAEEKIDFTGSVSGQTAYPGKVKGKVKILENEKDVSKIKKGEVLVTFATTPDFLPAMARAGAFVTDQGGVTSHAAITARELKKPYIIGTGYGTKVFKDGDLVEVDANKGIVKKL